MTSANDQTQNAVSAVLVSWNRCDELTVALRSLRAQDRPPDEIVVIDNCSTDGTVEMLRKGEFSPLILYRAPSNLGASVARNIGIRLARSDLVLFMDSDAELLEANTLPRLQEALAFPSASGLQPAASDLAAVAPAIFLDAERKRPWFLGGYYIRGLYCDRERGKAESENPEYLSTCVSLWRKDVVAELGGFDPALPYGFEDNDLSLRALQSGRRLKVLPECAARHHLSDTSRIRAETAGWPHFVYDERSRCMIQLKKLGFWGFIQEEAWQWSRAGREQRYNIFYETSLRRRQKLLLHTLVPLRALLAHPFTRRRNSNPDWINAAPIDESRIERA